MFAKKLSSRFLIPRRKILSKRFYCSEHVQDTNKFLHLFENKPFQPLLYPIWGRDIKEWENLHMSHGGSGGTIKTIRTLNFIRKWSEFDKSVFETVPFLEEANNAFYALAEKFEEKDLDSVVNLSGNWSGKIFTKWNDHCTQNSLSWHLEVDSIIESKITGIAAFFMPPYGQHDPVTLFSPTKTQNSPEFASIYRSQTYSIASTSPLGFLENPNTTGKKVSSIIAVWVSYDVKENFSITNNATGEKTQISTKDHPSKHIWKFGASASAGSQDFKWRVLDYDFLVAERIKSIVQTDKVTIGDLPVEEMWANEVI
eukprot:TRINITY_DN1139_c0_g1_i1.p1 TRINITY_DN1139_c0_g1~~TRINITY_DN1139_c0_g1_i1.p1  ORF type:complete len:313 (+),score=53.86 TRINITY_DN1139_c0_g1_i1:50-988(+)